MNKTIDAIILKSTGAKEILSRQTIQELWSGYGNIIRFQLKGASFASVVVKHIQIPRDEYHVRLWNSDISHQRKIKSYEVETLWYEKWRFLCSDSSPVPKLLGIEKINEEVLLIMEDLDDSGYPLRKHSVNWREIQAGLYWLANFHAVFLGTKPEGLWQTGTYWHLETRPEELNSLQDSDLKNAAQVIDKKLSDSKFQTFVHGDAKLANFCFSRDGKKAAAVDFQYIGGGCGMKDIAYFAGSCLNDSSCEKWEGDILDYYFSELKAAINNIGNPVDFVELEREWRNLYPLAWTDFYRFLKGWSPGHWKNNSYSERISREVIQELKDSGDLL